jgi:hypothetical protein
MRSSERGIAMVTRVLSVAALCVVLHSSAAAARVMYMVGDISGTVNGTAVNFDLTIRMDMETGEETASVGRMDPAMGAILRQVTAMVTVAGPTGGSTPHGGDNLFDLSGGNFVNSATMYWPGTGDQLELIHTVTYSGGDTMNVSATINGTVPVISARDEVEFADFTEIMYWNGDSCSTCPAAARAESATAIKQVESATAGAQVVTTGVGFRGDFSNAQFRSYNVGGNPFPGGGGKGSTTNYDGPGPSTPILRAARDITTTYDPVTRTMNVHLFNTLTPVESAP